VRETIHTRTSYRVDYYELHTGPVEPALLRHGEDGPVQTYQRLLAAELVTTCADCYQSSMIQAERERRFRPERQATTDEVPA